MPVSETPLSISEYPHRTKTKINHLIYSLPAEGYLSFYL